MVAHIVPQKIERFVKNLAVKVTKVFVVSFGKAVRNTAAVCVFIFIEMFVEISFIFKEFATFGTLDDLSFSLHR